MALNSTLGLGFLFTAKDLASKTVGGLNDNISKLGDVGEATQARMDKAMVGIGKGFAVAGTGAAMLAIPAAFVASTAKSQTALGELASLGVKDLQAVEDKAMEFSNKWSGTTTDEFISASYAIKSSMSNLSDEAVGTFTGIAGMTAKATKSTISDMTATFATGYGIFRNQFKSLSDEDWAKIFSGSMSKAVQAFNTEGWKMAEAVKNIGAAATSANVPMSEQLAILGQLQTTMPGSEAGNLYKSFITKASLAGKALGVQTVDKETGRLLGTIDIIRNIQKKFPDMTKAAVSDTLQKAFGSEEAVKYIKLLAPVLDTLESQIGDIAVAGSSGMSVTAEMAEMMNKGPAEQMEILQQRMANFMNAAGKTILPVAIQIMTAMGNVAEWVGSLAAEFPNATKWVLYFISVLGTLLVTIGSVMIGLGMLTLTKLMFKSLALEAVKSIGKVIVSLASMAWGAVLSAGSFIASLVPAIWAGVTAVWSFTAALLANPITWIVIGIVALIASIVLLVVYWDEVKAAVGSFVSSVVDWFSNTLVPALSSAWDVMASDVSVFVNSVVGWFSNTLVPALSSAWDTVVGYVRQGAAFMLEYMTSMIRGVLYLASKVPGIGGYATEALASINSVIEAVRGTNGTVEVVGTTTDTSPVSGAVWGVDATSRGVVSNPIAREKLEVQTSMIERSVRETVSQPVDTTGIERAIRESSSNRPVTLVVDGQRLASSVDAANQRIETREYMPARQGG